MKKGVVEEEIALCDKLRFIPITLTDSNNNITNEYFWATMLEGSLACLWF